MIGAAVLPGIAGMLGQKLGMEAIAAAAVGMASAMFLVHELLLRFPDEQADA